MLKRMKSEKHENAQLRCGGQEAEKQVTTSAFKSTYHKIRTIMKWHHTNTQGMLEIKADD